MYVDTFLMSLIRIAGGSQLRCVSLKYKYQYYMTNDENEEQIRKMMTNCMLFPPVVLP